MTQPTQRPALTYAALPALLTEEQRELRDFAHDFARRVLRPHALEWDQKHEFPTAIVEEAAQLGIYSAEPESLIMQALADPSGLSMPLITEELFWGDAGLALAVTGSYLALTGLWKTGTPDQIAEWTPQMFGEPGHLKFGAFCLSEPDAGSDVASLRTRAVYNEANDTWTINGTKMWITNGGLPGATHLVVASVDPSLKTRGQASFIVPDGTPGMTSSKPIDKLGMRASHTAEVSFADVVIPGSYLLGGKDKLDRQLASARARRDAIAAGQSLPATSAGAGAFDTLEATRPIVAAQALGVARAALEDLAEFTRNRKTFGHALKDNQSIAFDVAQMGADLTAARALTWMAAGMAAKGIPFQNSEGSMAKLKSAQVVMDICTRSVQMMGGMGFSEETGVPLRFRNAPIFAIFEGASQMQLLKIARAMYREPRLLG